MAPKAAPAVPATKSPSGDLVLSHLIVPPRAGASRTDSLGTGRGMPARIRAANPRLSRYASASLQYWKHFRTSTTGSAPRYSNSMSAGISYFLLFKS